MLDLDVEPKQVDFLEEAGVLSYRSIPNCSDDGLYELVRNELQTLEVHPNDVAILASTYEVIRDLEYKFRHLAHQNTTYAGETLEEHNLLGSDKLKIDAIRRGRKLHFWGNAGTTKFSTIHSFKGWETHTLVLIIENVDCSGLIETDTSIGHYSS